MKNGFHCHVVVEKHGRWYTGYVPEVPGVNAQERTSAAVRKSLIVALRELAEIDPRALQGRACSVEHVEVPIRLAAS